MHRIDSDGNVNNKFTDNPAPGQNATAVSADWLNAVQEECCAIVEQAGITLDKTNNAQAVAAILALIAAKITEHNGVTNAHSATSAATASRIIMRDANGRAKVAAPDAEDDIALKSNVTSEATARANADSAEATARTNADTTLTTNVNILSNRLTTVDSRIDNVVNAEAITRANADSALQSNIYSEATARANADSAEATTRQNADSSLQSQINTRTVVINNYWSPSSYGNMTTEQFLTLITNAGMFNYPSAVIRINWSYAQSPVITDTGFGSFNTAGCIVRTFFTSVDGNNFYEIEFLPPDTSDSRDFTLRYSRTPGTSRWIKNYNNRNADSAPVSDSMNAVTSGGVYNALAAQGPVTASITYNIGTGGDYATFNAALAVLSKKYPVYKAASGATFDPVRIRLLPVSGYTMAEQIIADGIDLSNFIIGSDSSIVTVSRDAILSGVEFSIGANSSYPIFAAVNGGKLPTIQGTFLMNGTYSGGQDWTSGVIAIGAGSSAILTPNSSIQSVYNCLCADRGGIITAVNSVLNSNSRGLYACNGGKISASNSNLSNSYNCAAFAQYGGEIDITGAVCSLYGNSGIVCTGGFVFANNCDARKYSASLTTDIVVNNGGIINAAGATGGTNQAKNSSTSSGLIIG